MEDQNLDTVFQAQSHQQQMELDNNLSWLDCSFSPNIAQCVVHPVDTDSTFFLHLFPNPDPPQPPGPSRCESVISAQCVLGPAIQVTNKHCQPPYWPPDGDHP